MYLDTLTVEWYRTMRFVRMRTADALENWDESVPAEVVEELIYELFHESGGENGLLTIKDVEKAVVETALELGLEIV